MPFYQSQLFQKYGLIAGTTYRPLNFTKENLSGNFEILSRELAVPKNYFKLADQKHTDQYLWIKSQNQKVDDIECDALITDLNQIVIGVKTADCIPLILFDTKSRTAAALHLGRSGIQKQLPQKVLNNLLETKNIQSQNLIAYIGPSLSAKSHAVFKEQLQGIDSKYYQLLPVGQFVVYNQQMFDDYNTKNGLKLEDYSQLQIAYFDAISWVKDSLLDFGVLENQIEIHPLDNFLDNNFHSYRRDCPNNGQNYTFISLN